VPTSLLPRSWRSSRPEIPGLDVARVAVLLVGHSLKVPDHGGVMDAELGGKGFDRGTTCSSADERGQGPGLNDDKKVSR